MQSAPEGRQDAQRRRVAAAIGDDRRLFENARGGVPVGVAVDDADAATVLALDVGDHEAGWRMGERSLGPKEATGGAGLHDASRDGEVT